MYFDISLFRNKCGTELIDQSDGNTSDNTANESSLLDETESGTIEITDISTASNATEDNSNASTVSSVSTVSSICYALKVFILVNCFVVFYTIFFKLL